MFGLRNVLEVGFVVVGSCDWMWCSDVVTEGCGGIAEERRDGGINTKCRSEEGLGDKRTINKGTKL